MVELLQLVMEAATWIEKVNPRFTDNYFRSEELRPESYLINNQSAYNKPCFNSSILKRRRALHAMGIPLLTDTEISSKGKLVLAAPLFSLLDGASAVESEGYFDDYEIAPWDTWVAIATVLPKFSDRKNYIVSWVPNMLLTSVQGGIDVNPLDIIHWPDSVIGELPAQIVLRTVFTGPIGLSTLSNVLYDKRLKQRIEYINNEKWIAEAGWKPSR